jgi:uncharacterized protein (DUF2267 family)
LDEFIQRVSKRANVTPEEGRRIAEAVFTTLREAVTGGEKLRDIADDGGRRREGTRRGRWEED